MNTERNQTGRSAHHDDDDVPDDAHRQPSLADRIQRQTDTACLFQDIIRHFMQEDRDTHDALTYGIKRICETFGWHVGHIAVLQEDTPDRRGVVHHWYPDDDAQANAYQSKVTQQINADPRGLARLLEGLDAPRFLKDLQSDDLLGQGDAAERCGLRCGVVAPIVIDDQPRALLGFYADQPLDDSESASRFIGCIASLIGQQVQLKGLQRAVTNSVWLLQRRVGRELHDSVCQDLVGLAFLSREMLASANDQSSPQGRREAQTLVEGVGLALSRARAICKGLSPIECLADELPQALGDLVDSSRKRFGVEVTLRCIDALTLASDEHARHLFFIAHEAVTNAVKHSVATRIDLDLDVQPGALRLRVSDNGTGLVHEQDTSSGIGMRIMRYRAEAIGARLTVRSDESGTTLTCTLPRKGAAS